ncbi:uncharacterized protein LOC114292023 [Camellia sinensis]|uniref:uncharacterized protein LOC114292023 n=1 Tax=Camellia sinensis TaxID=4442 RepID=UPI001036A90A|nr:uncharacterized protein LOC114292023 [Camellia sinensis]
MMDLHQGALMLLGPTMNAKVASELSERIPHLGLRMKEHSHRALNYSKRMKRMGVKVIYPGLEEHPDHNLLKSMANKEYGYGGLLCVDMETEERANRLMNNLQNITQFGFMAVSLGYHETLMSCSGSSTSSEMNAQEKAMAGISPGLVRMSIGYSGTMEQRWNQFEKALSRMNDTASVWEIHSAKSFCTEYEKSKAVADKIALDAASEGVPIVVVYPGVVYGPGKLTAGNIVARLIIERFNGRLPGYIGYGNDKFSFSHVDDVVEGHLAALNKGRPGERYLLTGENASFMHVFDIAAAITETKRPWFNIPLSVIEVYGWISLFFSKITGKLPLISPPTVYVLGHQWAYSCEKAKAELGYNPRSLQEGLAEVLPWLKSLGLIKY